MVQLYGGIHLSFRPTKVLDMEVVEFSFFSPFWEPEVHLDGREEQIVNLN